MTEFACRNVYEHGAAVLYAVHDHNDDWQMLCGGDEHDDKEEVVVVHKEHLQERDPGLAEVFDLERGWEAERGSADDSWMRRPFVEDEER